MADTDPLKIPISVDASGVPPGVNQTVQGLGKVEGATDAAAQAAQEMGAATAAAGAQSAEGARTAADGAARAAGGADALGKVSGATALTLARLKITQDEVGAAALRLGSSLEVTARAMIQIRDSQFADEIARAREQLEALQEQGNATTTTIGEGAKGATDNVDDLSGTLEFMGDDLTDNTEKGHRMIEEFGSMRESRRIAIELFEAFAGGGETIAGVSGILRTFLLTSNALAPEVAAVAAIGLALTGVIALHGKFGDSAKDAADAEDKISDSVARLQEESAKAGLDNLNRQLRDFLATQNELIHQRQEWDEAATKRRAQIEAETDALNKLTLATLEAQKQEALSLATTKEQRESIEANFASRGAAASGANEQKIFELKQADIVAQRAANDHERQQLLDANSDNDAKLQALKDRAATTGAKAREDGFAPDAAGNFNPAIEGQKKLASDAEDKARKAEETLDKARETWFSRAAQISPYDPILGGFRVRAETAYRNAQKDYDGTKDKPREESEKLADLLDAQQAKDGLEGTQGSDLRAAINKNTDAINKLVDARGDIDSKEGQNATEHQTALITAQGKAAEAAAIVADERQRKLREIRDNNLGARELELEKKQKGDPEDPALARQKTELENEKANNALFDKQGRQISSASPDELIVEIAQLRQTIQQFKQENTGTPESLNRFLKPYIDKLAVLTEDLVKNPQPPRNVDAELGASEERKTQAQTALNSTNAQQAIDKEQIAGLVGAAQASGNKQLIDAVRKIVEEDKGNPIKELADLVALHISKQTAKNAATDAAINQVKKKQENHSGQIASNANLNNN
jgi:hypothetical protein